MFIDSQKNSRSLASRWFGNLFSKSGWIIVLSLAWGLAGVLTFFNLKRDLFPNINLPIMSIFVQAPGLAAPELELSVAQPVEQSMGGIPGVKRVNTLIIPELVQVVVTFEGNADLWQSRQIMAERLSSVAGNFPKGTRPPLLTSASGRLHQLIEIVAEGNSIDPMRLRDYVEQVVAPRLQAVPGVARVDRQGGQEKSLQISLSPEKMRLLGATLDNVLASLEDTHQDFGAGVLEIHDKAWYVSTGSLAATPEEVSRLPLQVSNGWITLGEIADIREAPCFRRGLVRHDGHEDVGISIVKQPTASSLNVAKNVRMILDELREELPDGISLQLIYDQGSLVDRAINGVSLALLVGSVFVAFVLIMLLGNLRGSIVVLAVLPVATFGAAIPLYFANLGLDAMTLGGLAIAIGLLVDAAVIMVENLVHRLQENPNSHSRYQVMVKAATEVALPIFTAILVILAVFLPLISMGGLAGNLYSPLALAVASAMSISLVLSFTLVPVLVDKFIPSGATIVEPKIVGLIKRVYKPALVWALRHGALVRTFALALTIPCIWLAMHLGTNFLPTLDERAFMLLSKVPSESSLDAVDQANIFLDKKLKGISGVETVYRRTGRADVTEDPCPITDSEIMVILKPNANERVLREAIFEVAESMPFPVEVNTPMQERIAEGIGGTPADIQVKIFSRNLEKIRPLVEDLRLHIAEVTGVQSINLDTPDPLPRWRAVINEESIRRLGVPRTFVAKHLEASLQGIEAGLRFDGTQPIERIVRFAEPDTSSPETLKMVPIILEDGRTINLGQLIEFEETTTPTLIRREFSQPYIGLNIRTDGDLGGTVKGINNLLKDIKLPEGAHIKFGGKIEEAREANKRLTLAICASALLVTGLLFFALQRWREVLIVLATLPDAFAGGILALWLFGETWNISSIVGMIGLFGVAVQNSLVLISQAKGLIAQGYVFHKALEEASLGRVRPKLMTAGATILGLIPILLGFAGSELERPLAVVMIGGLITSTLFTLLALPSFYAWVGNVRTGEPNAELRSKGI
ncbi:MAG: efflux RND transporter permease subunit [Holophagaceae bacterium]|nr:efflux RND transporter permease subunit [Holophagaceae bacterium]